MRVATSVLFIFVFVMASCESPAAPASAPTLVPTATPHPGTPAQLTQAATLYSGPGNLTYDSLASLAPGTTVYTSGVYGDFVRVAAEIAGNDVTGFVWKNALEDPPGGLPVLDRLEVPWEPFFSPTCSPGKHDAATDTVTFDSISEDEGFYTNSAWRAVSAPIRIRIQALAAEAFEWSYKVTNTEWSDIKIAGITDLSIRSRGADGKYELDIHTTSGEIAQAIVVEHSSSEPIQILFDRPADQSKIGTRLSVLDEAGQVLTTLDLTALPELNLPDGIFPEGQLYFGTNTMPNSSLVITGLSIGSQPTGEWVEPANAADYRSSPGLSSLAQGRKISIGTEFLLTSAIDGRYCQIMQHDFNLASVSDLSWPDFWVGPGEYDWGPVDRAVDFAAEHGWRVRAGPVWGAPESLPDWLLDSNYTRDEYVTILQDHIRAVIGHLRGRVQEWTIANEANERILCNEASFYDFWYRKIGPDYIKVAFETAREEDPSGILILNAEYNFSSSYPPPYDCRNPTIKSMQDTVTALNAGPIKLIDVVGMQMHLLGAPLTVPPTKEAVLEIMRSFTDLGVRVAITEMDVNLAHIEDKYPSQEQRWAFQAGIYKDMLDACLESGACDGFTTMGIGDSMSWITTSCPGCWNKPEPDGDPLMFDDAFLPKQAYFAVRDVLAAP
jgi:endo-1,4-beta-xylanase